MNGLHVQESSCSESGPADGHKYLWANFRQTYNECLQNINLMIDNQLFLKQTSEVNQ